MIAKPFYKSLVLTFFISIFSVNMFSQVIENEILVKLNKTLKFYDYRATNAVEIGLGTSVMNGDLSEPLFEISSRIGYKHFILPHLNVNFSYNKFNLAYKDVYNEGFMSFDLNVEGLLTPYNKFSPFIYAGGGYNAANYFEQTATKVQGGIGVEYILTDKVGLKLFSDYNYVFSDELDGVIFGETDDTYWRILVGVNFYFGGEKKRENLLNGHPTIINSNPIIPDN